MLRMMCYDFIITNAMIVFAISGAHFKKWCIMQSKIKSGAVDEVCSSLLLLSSCINYLLMSLSISSLL